MHTSAFHLYSFGVAADNKQLNSNELEVIPLEIFPLTEGAVNSESQDIKYEGVDQEGKVENLSITVKPSITCKWLQWGSNRATPPDVRRGERILIYRYADSDNQYYWKETGLDDHLRRLETVVYLFSADPDGLSNTPRSPENSYSISISTHSKQISINTVKLNGEPFAYQIQLNTDVGALVIEDDIGNFIQLDSAEHCITLHNADDTDLKLDKENFILFAKNNYTADIKQNYSITCTNYSLNASESIKLTTASYQAEASDSYVITTNQVTVDSPESTITGNVNVGKDLTVGGKITASKGTIGGVSFDSGVMTCKTLTASQPISAPNV
jgi:phage baseplate assembly protein gpV